MPRPIALFSLLISAFLGLGAQGPLLRELAQEDQAARTGNKVTRTDEDRIAQVLEVLGRGAALTPEDRCHAALVLQHTPLAYCDGKLTSQSPHNYLLAHQLAKSAFQAGHAPARHLVAQTLDRYLSFTVGTQKYGTNRLIHPETGKETWVPIDRTTTDEERRRYGVPPLAELLKRFPEGR